MVGRVTVLDHPLVHHKLAILRDKCTNTRDFRTLVREITLLVTYEATKGLALESKVVETPVGTAECKVLAGKDVAVVPILRAGLGMVDGFLDLIPTAKVGHIGLYRDEDTLMPVEYYCKLPEDLDQRDVFVIDPMLATGGSASDAISQIKLRNPRRIVFMCLFAAPEGIRALTERHPDVDLFCAVKDDHLNERGYIVPGVGDAGDRIFGTLK